MVLFRGAETHTRSILKAVSWRTLGTLDTFAISWFFTGKIEVAGSIAGIAIVDRYDLDVAGEIVKVGRDFYLRLAATFAAHELCGCGGAEKCEQERDAGEREDETVGHVRPAAAGLCPRHAHQFVLGLIWHLRSLPLN